MYFRYNTIHSILFHLCTFIPEVVFSLLLHFYCCLLKWHPKIMGFCSNSFTFGKQLLDGYLLEPYDFLAYFKFPQSFHLEKK